MRRATASVQFIQVVLVHLRVISVQFTVQMCVAA